MTKHKMIAFSALLGSLLFGCLSSQAQRFPHQPKVSAGKTGGTGTATVFATDLRFPRGLKFGPDGRLYVAESVLGGEDNTVGLCDQDPNFDPFQSGPTSRVTSFDTKGNRKIAVDGLPSSIERLRLQPGRCVCQQWHFSREWV